MLQNVNFLVVSLILYNYFDNPKTKLFLDLYI